MADETYLDVDAGDLSRRLAGAAQREPAIVGEMLGKVALAVEAEAKKKAPVDTGALRASGGAEWDGGEAPPPASHTGTSGETGEAKTTEIPEFPVDAGEGEAYAYFTARYAAAQHEHTEYAHDEGQAKFLEDALKEAASGGMVERVAGELLKGMFPG